MGQATQTQTVTQGTDARESRTSRGSCCGGPAPAGADACCAQDAEAKSTGNAGCGCSSTAAASSPKKSACCG
jgi:hypothetical protein